MAKAEPRDKNEVIVEILEDYARKNPNVKTGDNGEKWMEIIMNHPKWKENFGNDRPAGPSIGKAKKDAGIFVAPSKSSGMEFVPAREVEVTAADMRNAWAFVNEHFKGDFAKAKEMLDKISDVDTMKKAFDEIKAYEDMKTGKKVG